MAARRSFLHLALLLIGLAGVTAARSAEREPIKFPDAQYEPVDWTKLDGWANDDHAAAFAAFLTSCRALNGERRPGRETAITEELKNVCRRAFAAIPLEEDGARKFFEDNFRPLRISKLGDSDGFLTGYYEPIIEGSRVPTGEFTAPLFRRPPNLVASGRRKLGDLFPNKGVKVGRRFGRRKIVPFYTRGEIEDGALDGWHLEICWLRSQLDVLFAQIQGSARIRLEDGTILRINYDSHNGWPYTPVGRVLIDRNIIPREEMSMQRIREWMQANPDDAKDVRRQNRSVVFFRIVGLTEDGEALGAQGIPLSAGRSIAVDKALHVYGTPFFIEADLPLASARANTPFRRTMIAQDTGSAIVGPARADLYFGAGEEAGQMAGRVRQAGRFALLLPRDLDPVMAGAHMPLPPARPTSLGAARRLSTARTANRGGMESKSESKITPTRFEHGPTPQQLTR